MRVRRLTPFLVACVLGLSLPVSAQMRLVTYASGFTLPIAIAQDPTDPLVQLVAEQGGRIRAIRNGVVQATDFLDLRGKVLSGGERGLLGLAFAPDYATSRRFFVDYTDKSGNTVVARYTRSTGNPLVADPDSGLEFLWSTGERFIRQPYANHNGGCLAFGSDGYLYIGMGDGGSGDDPQNNAQNPAQLLGKILRIDVSVADGDTKGFRIPADNPFAGSTRPEIWAFGVRNPWRFSFDDMSRGGNGALIIGDVGQGSWEEVDYEPRGTGGRNYGWPNREGKHAHKSSPAPAFLPLVDPIYEYSHSVGNSITGGYVYRGTNRPDMRGRYFFADYVKGRLWSMVITSSATGAVTVSNVVEHTSALTNGGTSIGNISSFGVDADGELFVLDYGRGRVLRLAEPPQAPTNLRIIR
jgi:glucose/arabinose dehydrogenase